MTFISRFLSSHKKIRSLLAIFISILFGLGWFLLLYGRFPLYFSHVNWIYDLRLDAFQHQLGWEWFRQEPWQFPLGRIVGYGYPFGTFLVFMDSIPLFAFPFKILSPWLGSNFQYFGIWDLACVIGQFLTGMLIFREFSRSYITQIVGASLLVLSPIMITRVFINESLAAHWILLVAIWFVIQEYQHKLWSGCWIALFGITMLVHFYFTAMLLPIWFIGAYFHYLREKNLWKITFNFIAISGVIFAIGYCIGIFTLNVTNLGKVDDIGFLAGYYSWNLNGFINPNTSSVFLKGLPNGPGSGYESTSYLGVGYLLIIFLAMIILIIRKNSRPKMSLVIPFGIVSVLLVLFSLSMKAYLGSNLIWDIRLPDTLISLLSIFRSSARFIWPVFYFLILFASIVIVRNFPFPALILVASLLLQYIDIKPLIDTKTMTAFASYNSPLQAPFWKNAAQTNQHIVFLPAEWPEDFYFEPIALYARKNHLTLNWGYFARGPYDEIKKYGSQMWADLKNRQADQKTIYIIWKNDWNEQAIIYLSEHMMTCRIDGYNVYLSVDNPVNQTDSSLSDYCSIPAR